MKAVNRVECKDRGRTHTGREKTIIIRIPPFNGVVNIRSFTFAPLLDLIYSKPSNLFFFSRAIAESSTKKSKEGKNPSGVKERFNRAMELSRSFLVTRFTMTSQPTRLLDLPNEILLNIWNAVLPNDIDNFANTCRHLRLLGKDVLEESRRLKRNHSYISLYDSRPSRLLCYYCYESRISHYPKKMIISPEDKFSIKNEEDLNALEWIRFIGEKKGDSFPFARIASLLESLDDDKLNGALTAITAGFLPHLERIFYIEDRLRSRAPEHFAEGLIKGILELTTRCVNPQVFPRLTHFSITSAQSRTFPTDLESFLPILTLPNLTSFEVSEFSCRRFDRLPFLPRTSTVETLEISPGRYSKKSILTLLSAFKALKTFKLRVMQCGAEWHRGFFPAIHECLLKYFQNSLQRLEIHDSNRYREFLGCLRPFPILKSVVIQPDMLFMNHDTMPRLIDMFPSSIQEIRFTRSLTETQEEEFFAGFLGHREATMPNLRLVVSCQLLSWRYKERQQPGGEFGFRYVKYYDDSATIRAIDTDRPAAASQWKVIQLSSDDLK